MLTREQFGKGRSSREVWLQAKVYLYVFEVCGDETWQTAEPVFFFFINHMIYNISPQASYKRSTAKHRTSYMLAAESINSSEIDGFQEPENESLTIT